MTNIFYISGDKQVTYSDLIDDINKSRLYYESCVIEDEYQLYLNLILSILLNTKITLLDADSPFAENAQVNTCSDSEPRSINVNVGSEEKLGERLLAADKWSMKLYTSGTAGIPKEVSHNLKQILKGIKISPDHDNDVWAQTYNPTHIAGIQVFFQALFNMNTIINMHKSSNIDIDHQMDLHAVTHISGTPTFYRMLNRKIFPKVKRVTSGGERFDPLIRDKISMMFPNATVSNIYASTEAGTILVSHSDIFEIPENLNTQIKIVEGELVISRELIGANEAITSGDWYFTGDLVEFIDGNMNSFRIKSRNSDMINVGGMKVNPHEVEDLLYKLEGVQDVRVYSKPNSLIGRILCSDILLSNSQLQEADIYKYLQARLPKYKIPRMINMVSQINMTRTGKKQR